MDGLRGSRRETSRGGVDGGRCGEGRRAHVVHRPHAEPAGTPRGQAGERGNRKGPRRGRGRVDRPRHRAPDAAAGYVLGLHLEGGHGGDGAGVRQVGGGGADAHADAAGGEGGEDRRRGAGRGQ